MKFLRYGEPGREKPGILDGNGVLRDLSGQVDDLAGDVLARLDSLTAGLLQSRAATFRIAAVT